MSLFFSRRWNPWGDGPPVVCRTSTEKQNTNPSIPRSSWKFPDWTCHISRKTCKAQSDYKLLMSSKGFYMVQSCWIFALETNTTAMGCAAQAAMPTVPVRTNRSNSSGGGLHSGSASGAGADEAKKKALLGTCNPRQSSNVIKMHTKEGAPASQKLGMTYKMKIN